ncbi:MAG: DUF389 domain-containing protein [Rubrobacteraceae bacterium]
MISLRITCAEERAARTLDLLRRYPTVTNVAVLRGAAIKPRGDLILCNVAREGASEVIAELQDLGVDKDGAIVIERDETGISDAAATAEKAAPGLPADAVVWAEVEAQTSESAVLSASFMVFMIVAVLIAAFGIYLNSSILIVGAMIVGPDYGPIAGVCVASIDRRWAEAGRSLVALITGFAGAIIVASCGAMVLRQTGLIAWNFGTLDGPLELAIVRPTALTAMVAVLAGVAGMLSLTTSKSGALIGVLVSVTTIPAAASIAVAAAYGAWEPLSGSALQLVVNVTAMILAGLSTLGVQRWIYERHRIAHRRALDRRRKAGSG